MPILIILTILISRATTLFTSMINDEETFVTFARVMLHGGTPYVAVVDNKPPGLFYWYEIILKLFGDTNVLAVHIAAMVWVALTCFVICKIGKKVYSQDAGYFAALCYAIFTTTYTPPYLDANVSLISALPLSLSFLYLLKWNEDDKTMWLFVSGLFTASAFLIKQQVLLQVPFTVLIFAYLYFAGFKGSLKKLFCGTLSYVAGLLLVSLFVFGVLYRQGALIPLYEATWKASLSYINLGESYGSYWHRFFMRAGTYFLGTSPIWVALIYKLFHRTIKSPYSVFLWLWLLINIPAVTTGGRFYGHYFIQLLPAACLIGGIQFSEWWNAPGKRNRILIGVVLSVFTIGWMIPRIFYQTLADRYGFHNLRVEKKIGSYLNEKMAPDGKLFVWGVDPGIYVLADRDPATRLLVSNSLVGRSPGIVETQQGSANTDSMIAEQDWITLFEDFTKNPPQYIVDCSSGNLRDYGKFSIRNYPRLHNYISIFYNKEATIEGVDIYRRKD